MKKHLHKQETGREKAGKVVGEKGGGGRTKRKRASNLLVLPGRKSGLADWLAEQVSFGQCCRFGLWLRALSSLCFLERGVDGIQG